jgi:mannose-6-phosphate isomerase-like protein (cupin superfamily)
MPTFIKHDNEIIAIIISAEFKKNGIEFFTPDEFSQQLAYMNRPLGYFIEPHVHKKVERSVHYTLETLFIRKGRVKIDFYTSEKKYIQSEVLKTGDVVLLASGGHGFTMLEPTEMIEVKQGPYASEMDKERFKGNTNG